MLLLTRRASLLVTESTSILLIWFDQEPERLNIPQCFLRELF